MKREEIFLLNSEIEIRRRAAKVRAEYLRGLFADLGQRMRAAVGARNSRKNGQKVGNRVGGATA